MKSACRIWGTSLGRADSTRAGWMARALATSLLGMCSLTVLAQPIQVMAAPIVEGELVIVGSGNMAGFLRAMGRGFARKYPGARVKVEARTSSSGPPALLHGRAGLASMSRPMNAQEQKAFRIVHDAEPTAISVAVDALAIYVSRENPMERITMRQLDDVFSSTHTCGGSESITKWSQLGLKGDVARHDIGLYGHVSSAGTHEFFRERALCGGSFRAGVREQPGPRSVILSITESDYAMGYGASADIGPGVKALEVGRASQAYGKPEAGDVYSGAYPLSRELLLYRLPAGPDPKQTALVNAFLEYALSEVGQQEVEKARFFPLPPKRLGEERAELSGQ